jgi:hypothetical protein
VYFLCGQHFMRRRVFLIFIFTLLCDHSPLQFSRRKTGKLSILHWAREQQQKKIIILQYDQSRTNYVYVARIANLEVISLKIAWQKNPSIKYAIKLSWKYYIETKIWNAKITAMFWELNSQTSLFEAKLVGARKLKLTTCISDFCHIFNNLFIEIFFSLK